MRNFVHRNEIRKSVVALAVSFLMIYAPMASAAMNMFLQIDGIPGESEDEVFPDAIDLTSFGWGLSIMDGGQGGGGGGVSVQDITLVKTVDNASIGLMMSASTGATIPEALLVVRRAGEKPLEYFAIQLENVSITSYQISGSGDDTGVVETVTLSFGKITTHYRKQDKDGNGGPVKSDCYDVWANASCN